MFDDGYDHVLHGCAPTPLTEITRRRYRRDRLKDASGRCDQPTRLVVLPRRGESSPSQIFAPLGLGWIAAKFIDTI